MSTSENRNAAAAEKVCGTAAPLAWGDEVCGVKVTPEMAVKDGWIIQLADGRWRIFGKGRCDHEVIETFKVEGGEIVTDGMSIDRHVWYHSHGKVTECRPIFPPRGWAGKTDAELWAGAIGLDDPWDDDGTPCLATLRLADIFCLDFEMNPRDYRLNFEIEHSAGRRGGIPIDTLPALEVALRNIQLMAARLHPEKEQV